MYRGRTHSTGGSSQQGLLPEVYRTANTGEVSSPMTECSTSYGTKNPTTKHTLPHKTLAVYIANDTLRHRPMEAGHMTVLVLQGLLDSYPALLLYLAGDALYQQPMVAGHMTAPVMWAVGGIPCPTLVSPNACLQ